MNINLRLSLLFGLFILLFTYKANATHLMGGNLAYEYITPQPAGLDPNLRRYRIVLTTYTNCDNTSNLPIPEASLTIGVYTDPTGAATNSGTKTLFTQLNIPRESFAPIIPALPPGCTITNPPCINEAFYVDTVDLPVVDNGNFVSYWLYYDRCCRNGNILNLANPGNEGIAFMAYIPPALLQNSSPVFNAPPLPFVCQGDTTSILNTATDPDGDLLQFSFVDPYSGYSTAANPAPNPPANLVLPVPTVAWQTGSFSANQPFGPSGYAFINGFTGYSEYLIPTNGNRSIAVEIKEFRNNVLIGITRRDIQFLTLNCQGNAAPVNVNPTTSGSPQLNYTIEEGQSLTFDVEFTDVSQAGAVFDTLIMVANGAILDPTQTNPAATIPSPVGGDTLVQATFNWNTACGQGRALPYTLDVSATDAGCLPQTSSSVYTITVNPFQGPTSISGTTTVCPGQSQTYSVPTIANATYTWVVSGGTITSGNGTNSIDVAWQQNAALGNVSVFATSQFGCNSATIDTNISILQIPIDAGNPVNACIGDTVTVGGSPTTLAGFNVSWQPSALFINPTAYNPSVIAQSDTMLYVTATNSLGCVLEDSVQLTTITSPSLDAGLNTSVCLGDTATLLAIGTGTIVWNASASLIDLGNGNAEAFPTSTTTYYVQTSNATGCNAFDSVIVSVTQNLAVNAGNDTSICVGDSIQLGGNPTSAPGSTYAWRILGGPVFSTLANPVIIPPVSVTLIVDATDAQGCTGSDTIVVTVNSAPTAGVSPTSATICTGDTATFTATGGASYSWLPNSFISATNTQSVDVFPNTTTTYSVIVTNANNCTDTADVTVTVNNFTANISINDTICLGDTGQLSVTPAGLTYNWNGSSIIGSTQNNSISANPTNTATYTVTVTDANSCSDTLSGVIAVLSNPFANAGNDTSICENSTLTLGGTPAGTAGATFNWVNIATGTSAGLNNGTTANPIFSGTSNASYALTVALGSGCVANDTINIIVNPLPTVDAGNNVTICLGDSTQLQATGTGSFAWSNAASLTNASVANPIAGPTVTTQYFVTLTDANGCANTDSVTVSVNSLPSGSISNDTTICINDSINLFVSGGVSYQWTNNATILNPTTATPTVFPTTNTTYFVTVTDANNCTIIDSVIVGVNALPTVNAGNDTSICSGASLVLGGTPTGPTGASFAWTPTTNLSSSSVANPTANPSASTSYSVEVTDANGCVNSDVINVTVNPLPFVDAGNNATICLGDSAQLQATGVGTFAWSNAASLTNASIANPIAGPTVTTQYFVTITNANGCTNVDSVTVSVNSLPSGSISNDTTICINDSINLFVSGGTSYQWTNNASILNPTSATPTVFPTTNTTYFVTVTDANNCTLVDSVVVTVNALPTVNAGNDTSICVGASVVLGGTPTGPTGASFTWTPTTNLSASSVANPTATPTITTTYSVEVTDGNSCVNADSVVITVNSLPVYAISSDTSICSGDSAVLFVSGAMTNNYTWSAGVTQIGQNAGTIFYSVQPSSTDTFVVSISNVNSCTVSDTVIVSILNLPQAVGSNDAYLCPGDTLQLNASGGVTYTWNTQVGLSDSTIANPNAFPSATTTYIVSVTDANNCTSTDSVTVTVNANVPTNAGLDVAICAGDTIQIGGAPTAPANSTYSWSQINGSGITLISSTDSNPFITSLVSGDLIVQVANDTCTGVDTVSLVVNALPTLSVSNDTSICINDSIQLNAQGGVTYLWSSTAAITNPNSNTPAVSPTDTSVFFVTVTDAQNCSSSDSVTVNVLALPTLITSNDTTICFGETANLSVAGALVYSWSPGSSLNDSTIANPIAGPTNTTTYLVNATDANTCSNVDSVIVTVAAPPSIVLSADDTICAGDSTVLNVSGGTNYTWIPNTFISDNTSATPTVYPTVTTTYTVLVNGANSCTGSDSVTVFVNQLPFVDAGSNDSICAGSFTQLNATGASTYTWASNTTLSSTNGSSPIAAPENTTTYFVSGTDVNGCVNTDSVIITVNALPNVNAGTDVFTCKNGPIQIGGNPISTDSIINVLWLPSSLVSDAKAENPLATVTKTTDFYLTVVDTNLCSNSDTVTVFVMDLVRSTIDTTACDNDTFAISVNVNDATAPLSYSWSPSTFVVNANDSVLTINPKTTTTYTVVVTDGLNCVDSTSIVVRTKSGPTASLEYELLPNCFNLNSYAYNNSFDAEQIEWFLNNSLFSSDDAIEFIVDYNANTQLKLVAYSPNNCSSEVVTTISTNNFEDYFNAELPKVFTPNNDGINDFFELPVESNLSDCIDFRVYTRWGDLVFQSSGFNKSWDGTTFDGRKVDSGVYFYVIEIKDMIQKGTVTLNR